MPLIAQIREKFIEDRNELERISRSLTSPRCQVERAKIILKAVEGKTIEETAGELSISSVSVCKWRKRFAMKGIAGLRDLPRSGRPFVYDNNAVVEGILSTLEEKPPKGTTVWTGKDVAKLLGISEDKVHRVLREKGVCLCRKRTWCVSNDPDYAAKAADVTALKVFPPEDENVISIDEKTCVQAIERPCGYVRDSNGKVVIGQKSTYRRNGTTNIFALWKAFHKVKKGLPLALACDILLLETTSSSLALTNSNN
jgi:transposase